MKKYETPELKAIYYDVDESVMDGYNDGDTGNNPWEEMFTDKASMSDASDIVNVFRA